MEQGDPLEAEQGTAAWPSRVMQDVNIVHRGWTQNHRSLVSRENARGDRISSLFSPGAETTPLLAVRDSTSVQRRCAQANFFASDACPQIHAIQGTLSRPDSRRPWRPDRSTSTQSCGRQSFGRPKSSAYVLLPMYLLIALNAGACIAPRIQLYRKLVCLDFYQREAPIDEARITLKDPIIDGTLSFSNVYQTRSALMAHPDAMDRCFALAGRKTGLESTGPTELFFCHAILSTQHVESRPTNFEFVEKNSPPDEYCRMDHVQSQVAKLNLAVTLVTGVLSSITTSKWGSMSDIKGRVWVMKIGIWGTIAMDVALLSVIYFAPILKGYWLLLIGAFADGVMGGWAAGNAAFHAYMADCVPARDRVRYFSTMMATYFIGLAIGPTIGAHIAKVSGNITVIFWIATVVHLIYFCFACSLLPESLSTETREEVSRRRESEMRATATRNGYNLNQASSGLSVITSSWFWRIHMQMTDIVRPAVQFLPFRRVNEEGYVWDLLFIAIVYFIIFLMMGLYPINLIYVSGQFGWTPIEQGYFVSGLSALKVLHLLVTLPAIIRFLKPKGSVSKAYDPERTEVVPPREGESRSHRSTNTFDPNDHGRAISYGSTDCEIQASSPVKEPQSAKTSTSRWEPSGVSTSSSQSGILSGGESATDQSMISARRGPVQASEAELRFDLQLARASIFSEIIGYVLMANARDSRMFVFAAVILSLSSAASPSTQSLALSFADQHTTGRLIAGLSVLQGLSGIIGPLLFGGVYSYNVGTWPNLPYHIAWVLLLVALLLLCCVKLHHKDVDGMRASLGAY